MDASVRGALSPPPLKNINEGLMDVQTYMKTKLTKKQFSQNLKTGWDFKLKKIEQNSFFTSTWLNKISVAPSVFEKEGSLFVFFLISMCASKMYSSSKIRLD